jgi:hypothetical protein
MTQIERLIALERESEWTAKLAALDVSLSWAVATNQWTATQAADYRAECLDRVPLDAFVVDGNWGPLHPDHDPEAILVLKAKVLDWVLEDPDTRDPTGHFRRDQEL